MTASLCSYGRTRRAFLWTAFLDTPFWVIFNMLPFILYKDLGATPLQVTVALALKPVSSLLAMYWGAHPDARPDRLLPNVIFGSLLRHLPFLFCPFVSNPWFYVAAFGFHMVLARGAKPAWMEILKLNIPEGKREKTFTLGTTMNYVGDALLPFLLGYLLDASFEAWRWIFPMTALLSISTIFLQLSIPIPQKERIQEVEEAPLKSLVVKPWKEMWRLIRKRRDYLHFQIGFMLGGAGLMIIHPVLVPFFADTLKLSYTEFAIAITTCKGVGFALVSPFWARLFQRVNIFRFASLVTAIACLCPLFLLLAKERLIWLYVSYLLYGAMQAGSSLSWNMSGPFFSREEESSVCYTNINVATVGLRGCFVPFLGIEIAAFFGIESALIAGSLLCLVATLYMAASPYYERDSALLRDS